MAMQSTSPSQLRDLHWHTAVACLILRLFQLVMTERGRQTSITDLEARLASLQATERCLRQEITDIENSIRDSRAYYKAFRRLGRDTLRVARRYVECCRVVNDNSRSTRTRQAHAIERDTIVAQDGVDAEDLILLNNLDGWQPPHSKDAVTQWKAIIATKTTDLSRVTQAIFGCLQSIQNARQRSRSRSRGPPGPSTRQLSLPQPPLAIPPYAQPQPAQPSRPRRQSSGHNHNPGSYNPNAFYGPYYPQR